MHTVLRIYTGMPGVAPRFVAARADLEKVLKAIPGFAGYRLIATADGIATVTICETKEGCDQSVEAAAAWIKTHMPELAPKPPQVIVGESLISFGANRPPK